jgi:Coenzyme PQQ synthesis protein D (PqqD)
MADCVVAIRDSGVLHERLNDDVIAIDLERGLYYGMVGTAADIWTSFERPTTVAAVAQALVRRYGESNDQVWADVRSFASQLETAGLLVPAAVSAEADRPAADVRAASTWAAPVLDAYDDMANLLLRDPTYLMDELGWPHLPDPAP